MRVELSIADDTELRNMTKDLIKGQVRSLTRQELLWRVQEEILKKSKINDKSFIENEIQHILKEEVRKAIRPSMGLNIIEKTVRDEVMKQLKNIKF